MKYAQIKDDEWFSPKMKGHKMACCDCGLVHHMDFKIVKGQVFIRPKRARNLTAQFRKTISRGGK